MSLTGVTVLLVLEPAAAAEATRRGVRQRVAAAGGRCSINGTPPLAAYELSHIVSDGWDTLRRRAPSLARRHAGSDGPPPKRQRVVTPSLPPQQQQQQQLTQGSDICHLVTQAWLTTTLLAGEPQPESEFVLPLCAGAGVDPCDGAGARGVRETGTPAPPSTPRPFAGPYIASPQPMRLLHPSSPPSGSVSPGCITLSTLRCAPAA